MTELQQLCLQMIEALEMLYKQGKITKEEFEEHVRLKREYLRKLQKNAV